MKLFDALRLGAADTVAFVGAGGKTSAMFQLASEVPTRSVFLTTTTHLAVEQTFLADCHFTIHSPVDIDLSLSTAPGGILLFTGRQIENGRVAGLDSHSLERLRQAAQISSFPLLIEADGGRQRALKAPAEHEPVIPPWVDCVVVVAGLSGLNHPLQADWVHRPEQFATLADLSIGENITPEAVTLVLTNDQGGLKNIPPGARRVVLLNQADDVNRQSQAGGMAKRLLEQFSQVIVASLAPGADKEKVQPSELPLKLSDPVMAVHEHIAGIVLAAGSSTRLGTPKQLLEWHGQPLVRWAAQAALDGGLHPVVVVTGSGAVEVQAALTGLPVKEVFNPDWAAGQSTSLASGLRGLPEEIGGAIFLLADQPFVTAELVRSLVEQHAQSLEAIVAPLIDGQRANPVLFDCRTFTDLLALSGDTGGRALFARYPVSWLPWHDSRVLTDVDTLDDYRRLEELDL